MKYKDVYNMFTQHGQQIKMALRVRRCRPYIRKAINDWMTTREEPNLEVLLAPKRAQGKSVLLSAQSLIHEYGMSPLDALLFIDWANRTDRDIHEALYALVHRSDFKPTHITEEMWRQIDPEVMREFQAIESQKQQRISELQTEYDKIENFEIDECDC